MTISLTLLIYDNSSIGSAWHFQGGAVSFHNITLSVTRRKQFITPLSKRLDGDISGWLQLHKKQHIFKGICALFHINSIYLLFPDLGEWRFFWNFPAVDIIWSISHENVQTMMCQDVEELAWYCKTSKSLSRDVECTTLPIVQNGHAMIYRITIENSLIIYFASVLIRILSSFLLLLWKLAMVSLNTSNVP